MINNKHYFKTQEGTYSVILLAQKTVDIDKIAFIAPQFIKRHHKEGNIDIRWFYRRAWSGGIEYEECVLNYAIVEEFGPQFDLVSIAVVGDPSTKSLEERTNQILGMFGLIEVSSHRQTFKDEDEIQIFMREYYR